jgi:hypothetical protein
MNSGLAQISVTRHCRSPLICDDPPFICVICVKKTSLIGRDADEPNRKKVSSPRVPLADRALP